MPEWWKRPDLPPRDWMSRIDVDNSHVRNGNAYTRSIPEEMLGMLKTLCIKRDHLQSTGFPFLYKDWKPWTVMDGFMRPPEAGRHKLSLDHVMTLGKIPVSNIAPRKAVVLSTLTVRTVRSAKIGNPTHYKAQRGDALVWVTLIDYFTGEELVNSLVRTDEKVVDWRTKETGISADIMRKAVENGNTYLDGWEAARDKLWEYIDEDTVVVGHTVCKSLWALRMVHGLIVDLRIVIWRFSDDRGFWNIQTEKPLCDIDRSLYTLTLDLLGLQIGKWMWRNGNLDPQRRDLLEEVLASREIITWCLNNRELVTNWWMALKSGYIKQQVPSTRRWLRWYKIVHLLDRNADFITYNFIYSF